MIHGADGCTAFVGFCDPYVPQVDLPFTPAACAVAYPKRCQDCGGSGWVTSPSSWDGPGETDYCYSCFGDGRCPRCAHRWRQIAAYRHYTDDGILRQVKDWKYSSTFESMREGSIPCPHCGYDWTVLYSAGGRALDTQPDGHWTPQVNRYGPWDVQAVERLPSPLDGWVRATLYQPRTGNRNAVWIPPQTHGTVEARRLVWELITYSVLGNYRPVVRLADRGTRVTPAGEIFWWEIDRLTLQPREHTS